MSDPVLANKNPRKASHYKKECKKKVKRTVSEPTPSKKAKAESSSQPLVSPTKKSGKSDKSTSKGSTPRRKSSAKASGEAEHTNKRLRSPKKSKGAANKQKASHHHAERVSVTARANQSEDEAGDLSDHWQDSFMDSLFSDSLSEEENKKMGVRSHHAVTLTSHISKKGNRPHYRRCTFDMLFKLSSDGKIRRVFPKMPTRSDKLLESDLKPNNTNYHMWNRDGVGDVLPCSPVISMDKGGPEPWRSCPSQLSDSNDIAPTGEKSRLSLPGHSKAKCKKKSGCDGLPIKRLAPTWSQHTSRPTVYETNSMRLLHDYASSSDDMLFGSQESSASSLFNRHRHLTKFYPLFPSQILAYRCQNRTTNQNNDNNTQRRREEAAGEYFTVNPLMSETPLTIRMLDAPETERNRRRCPGAEMTHSVTTLASGKPGSRLSGSTAGACGGSDDVPAKDISVEVITEPNVSPNTMIQLTRAFDKMEKKGKWSIVCEPVPGEKTFRLKLTRPGEDKKPTLKEESNVDPLSSETHQNVADGPPGPDHCAGSQDSSLSSPDKDAADLSRISGSTSASQSTGQIFGGRIQFPVTNLRHAEKLFRRFPVKKVNKVVRKSLSEVFREVREEKGCLINNCKTCGYKGSKALPKKRIESSVSPTPSPTSSNGRLRRQLSVTPVTIPQAKANTQQQAWTMTSKLEVSGKSTPIQMYKAKCLPTVVKLTGKESGPLQLSEFSVNSNNSQYIASGNFSSSHHFSSDRHDSLVRQTMIRQLVRTDFEDNTIHEKERFSLSDLGTFAARYSPENEASTSSARHSFPPKPRPLGKTRSENANRDYDSSSSRESRNDLEITTARYSPEDTEFPTHGTLNSRVRHLADRYMNVMKRFESDFSNHSLSNCGDENIDQEDDQNTTQPKSLKTLAGETYEHQQDSLCWETCLGPTYTLELTSHVENSKSPSNSDEDSSPLKISHSDFGSNNVSSGSSAEEDRRSRPKTVGHLKEKLTPAPPTLPPPCKPLFRRGRAACKSKRFRYPSTPSPDLYRQKETQSPDLYRQKETQSKTEARKDPVADDVKSPSLVSSGTKVCSETHLVKVSSLLTNTSPILTISKMLLIAPDHGKQPTLRYTQKESVCGNETVAFTTQSVSESKPPNGRDISCDKSPCRVQSKQALRNVQEISRQNSAPDVTLSISGREISTKQNSAEVAWDHQEHIHNEKPKTVSNNEKDEESLDNRTPPEKSVASRNGASCERSASQTENTTAKSRSHGDKFCKGVSVQNDPDEPELPKEELAVSQVFRKCSAKSMKEDINSAKFRTFPRIQTFHPPHELGSLIIISSAREHDKNVSTKGGIEKQESLHKITTRESRAEELTAASEMSLCSDPKDQGCDGNNGTNRNVEMSLVCEKSQSSDQLIEICYPGSKTEMPGNSKDETNNEMCYSGSKTELPGNSEDETNNNPHDYKKVMRNAAECTSDHNLKSSQARINCAQSQTHDDILKLKPLIERLSQYDHNLVVAHQSKMSSGRDRTRRNSSPDSHNAARETRDSSQVQANRSPRVRFDGAVKSMLSGSVHDLAGSDSTHIVNCFMTQTPSDSQPATQPGPAFKQSHYELAARNVAPSTSLRLPELCTSPGPSKSCQEPHRMATMHSMEVRPSYALPKLQARNNYVSVRNNTLPPQTSVGYQSDAALRWKEYCSQRLKDRESSTVPGESEASHTNYRSAVYNFLGKTLPRSMYRRSTSPDSHKSPANRREEDVNQSGSKNGFEVKDNATNDKLITQPVVRKPPIRCPEPSPAYVPRAPPNSPEPPIKKPKLRRERTFQERFEHLEKLSRPRKQVQRGSGDSPSEKVSLGVSFVPLRLKKVNLQKLCQCETCLMAPPTWAGAAKAVLMRRVINWQKTRRKPDLIVAKDSLCCRPKLTAPNDLLGGRPNLTVPKLVKPDDPFGYMVTTRKQAKESLEGDYKWESSKPRKLKKKNISDSDKHEGAKNARSRHSGPADYSSNAWSRESPNESPNDFIVQECIAKNWTSEVFGVDLSEGSRKINRSSSADSLMRSHSQYSPLASSMILELEKESKHCVASVREDLKHYKQLGWKERFVRKTSERGQQVVVGASTIHLGIASETNELLCKPADGKTSRAEKNSVRKSREQTQLHTEDGSDTLALPTTLKSDHKHTSTEKKSTQEDTNNNTAYRSKLSGSINAGQKKTNTENTPKCETPVNSEKVNGFSWTFCNDKLFMKAAKEVSNEKNSSRVVKAQNCETGITTRDHTRPFSENGKGSSITANLFNDRPDTFSRNKNASDNSLLTEPKGTKLRSREQIIAGMVNNSGKLGEIGRPQSVSGLHSDARKAQKEEIQDRQPSPVNPKKDTTVKSHSESRSDTVNHAEKPPQQTNPKRNKTQEPHSEARSKSSNTKVKQEQILKKVELRSEFESRLGEAENLSETLRKRKKLTSLNVPHHDVDKMSEQLPMPIPLRKQAVLDAIITSANSPRSITPSRLSMKSAESPAAFSMKKSPTLESTSAFSMKKSSTVESPSSFSMKKSSTAESPTAFSMKKSSRGESPTACSMKKSSTLESPSSVSMKKSSRGESPTACSMKKTVESPPAFGMKKSSTGESMAVINMKKSPVGETPAVCSMKKSLTGESMAVYRMASPAVFSMKKSSTAEYPAVFTMKKSPTGEPMAVLNTKNSSARESPAACSMKTSSTGESMSVFNMNKSPTAESTAESPAVLSTKTSPSAFSMRKSSTGESPTVCRISRANFTYSSGIRIS